jgi:hypothetical protein
MQYYSGAGMQKVRLELLGEGPIRKPWHLYLREDLIPLFKKRYEQIKGGVTRVDGFKPKPKEKPKKEEKPKVKRSINWNNIKKLIASPKTKPHIKAYWEERMKKEGIR